MLKIRNFNEIPGPRRMPILGSLYLYKLGIYKVDEYRDVLLQMYNKFGPLVREDIGPRNVIIHAFDPADAKAVLEGDGAMPRVQPLQETTQLYRKRKNTSPGLGNTNGEEWYRLRSAVRKPMLRPGEVQRYLPVVNQITDDLVRRITERRDRETCEMPNLRSEIGKWSREISGWICFERRLGGFDEGENEEEAEKMIAINRRIFELSSKLKFSLPIYRVVETPSWKKLVSLEEIIHDHVCHLILKSLRGIHQQMDSPQTSFLSYLLSRSELSARDVEILILSVFGDGLSTTVPSLIYNLYCLATNPKVQEEVRGEVQQAAESDNYISAESVNSKLHLLKAFVKETFRLYPIGTEISRILQTNLVLSNYHVPKGTNVHLNQIVHYKSDKYFKLPERFQPERWLRDGNDDRDPLLLIPFGHGTRTCAGRRFAEQDLYISLAKILLNFRLEYPGKCPPLKQTYKVLLFPTEPVRIQFKPLSKRKSTF